MLLGFYSSEPRPNSRALGTVCSVMTIGLSLNRCSQSKKKFDERKQDYLVQKFGLRRLQIQSPFLIRVKKDDKKRSSHRIDQGTYVCAISSFELLTHVL